VLLGILFGILTHTVVVVAGPILKPRKYHGPIPRNTVTLRVGFLGGPNNEKMIEYLDDVIAKSAGEAFTTDFENSLVIDATYMYKVHPQVAVRGNLTAAFLRSESNGNLIPPRNPVFDDSVRVLPALDYDRSFDVDLFTLEASAVYFFSDASVNEFQPYIGGGFSLGVPHAKLKDERVVAHAGDATDYYSIGDVYSEADEDKWSGEAGVHGVLGALYYVTNRFAMSLEGRYQVMQSKFPIKVGTTGGQSESVKFDVHYSGFILNFGTAYSF
jgi:hypothetical protein